MVNISKISHLPEIGSIIENNLNIVPIIHKKELAEIVLQDSASEYEYKNGIWIASREVSSKGQITKMYPCVLGLLNIDSRAKLAYIKEIHVSPKYKIESLPDNIYTVLISDVLEYHKINKFFEENE